MTLLPIFYSLYMSVFSNFQKSVSCIAELDKLFTRLYEDNVSGKISDERFAIMSKGYEDEQSSLKTTVIELTAYIETAGAEVR